jgi:hypothetical protein
LFTQTFNPTRYLLDMLLNICLNRLGGTSQKVFLCHLHLDQLRPTTHQFTHCLSGLAVPVWMQNNAEDRSAILAQAQTILLIGSLPLEATV